jgi:hypothetical protein
LQIVVEKDKKSKDAKNEQVNEKELRQYPKENLYDEPEMSPEIIKRSEPIYEEADQDITPFRPAKGKQPLSPPVEPSLYAVAINQHPHMPLLQVEVYNISSSAA